MARSFILVSIVVLLATPGLPAQVTNFRPVTEETLRNPAPGDWLNWRRTDNAWGYSPLDEIDRENVGQLQLVWSWAMDDDGAQEATPLVYDGIMYLPNPRDVIQALDSANGKQYVAVPAGVGGASWGTLIPSELIPEITRPDHGNSIFVFALPDGSR